MDGGKDDWSYVLNQNADIVLPFLVLMAESKDAEGTKHDTDGTKNASVAKPYIDIAITVSGNFIYELIIRKHKFSE